MLHTAVVFGGERIRARATSRALAMIGILCVVGHGGQDGVGGETGFLVHKR